MPGWGTQVSRLWMWGAPRDRPGPCQTGEHWCCPCQAVRHPSQEDLSLFLPRQPEGQGKGTKKWFQWKEPKGGVGQKAHGAHCEHCPSVPALRPYGVSRRRVEGHLGRDWMGTNGSATPGAKETREKPLERLRSWAQGHRQGATRPPLRAMGNGNSGSSHGQSFWVLVPHMAPGSRAGEACVWKASPPPPSDICTSLPSQGWLMPASHRLASCGWFGSHTCRDLQQLSPVVQRSLGTWEALL